jgi:non-heme chloroperoxidase
MSDYRPRSDDPTSRVLAGGRQNRSVNAPTRSRNSVTAIVLLAFTVLSSVAACSQNKTEWKDPSKHTVQFVTVEPNVQLEILDWGGAGRSVVLLAGYGNSAHVFDEFAEKLSESNRVYGITRRGFGYSSHVTSGYDAQHLAADVLYVLDSLKIAAPVLAGHSYAGKEMTILGKLSDRIAGLVYLDALSDPTYDWTEYNVLRARRPPERYSTPPPPRGAPTFEEYMKWQPYGRRAPFPEGEIHAITTTTSDGRMGERRIAPHIGEAIAAGMGKPDYAAIKVPALAFVAYPAPVEDQTKDYEVRNDEDLRALENLYAADQKYLSQFIADFQSAVPTARVIRMFGASHYIFISNQTDVLFEMRSFMSRLR